LDTVAKRKSLVGCLPLPFSRNARFTDSNISISALDWLQCATREAAAVAVERAIVYCGLLLCLLSGLLLLHFPWPAISDVT
jgi:hypothetical protein